MGHPTNFENLVLIVGTNPLPDLVTALHFLNTNSHLKKIFLIHSTGNLNGTFSTKKYADNLVKLLRDKFSDINIDLFGVDNIESIKSIYTELSSKKEFQESWSFHVNLTGGTKTMGIGVYEYFKEKAEFSYLSARDFVLYNENGISITGDLRKEISLELNDVLAIHNFYKFNKDKTEKFDSSDVDMYFKVLIEENKLKEFLDYWEKIRGIFKSNRGTFYKKEVIINNFLEYQKQNPIHELFLEICNKFPDNFKILDDSGKLYNYDRLPTKETIVYLIDYIDGDWFEKYISEIFRNKVLENINIYYNWEVKNYDWKNNKSKFELDIILIKGYQLYIISLTSANKIYLIKSKAFEVINRSRQIGGQEARSVLVHCGDHDINELIIEQMLNETGSGDNFNAIGIDNIKENNLINIILDFINKER